MDTKQIEELVDEIIQGADDRYAIIMKSYQTPKIDRDKKIEVKTKFNMKRNEN
ncbi:hypothetical protein [Brevibacillus brevis]|uniref:hypothetical protein n=1 Tax=Brevibacillus brevis TaxID=1393 RepID=UPI001EE2A8A1|nr:hypothetical protein [Brevibacillus brevis]